MSFMKTLQSIGILEKDPQPSEKTAAQTASSSAPLTVADIRSIGEPQPSASLDNERLQQHLEESIQSNPAFAPAATFLAAIDSIKDVIAEEGLRFRTAKATTKLDTTTLITALQAHDESLQYEAGQFEKGVVTPNIDRINMLEAHAGELQVKIDDLQQQITQLAAEKDQVNADIITSNANLEKAKVDFKATAAKVGQRYSELAKKVSQYLGA